FPNRRSSDLARSFCVSSCRTAPPPTAITPSHERSPSATTSRSRARKCSSPSSMKMSPIGLPVRFSISVSVHSRSTPSLLTSASPTVDLPEPGAPMITAIALATLCLPRGMPRPLRGVAWECPLPCLADPRRGPAPRRGESAHVECDQVTLDVALGLGDRVTTELLDDGLGQHKGDHGFGDNPCCGNRGDVTALMMGLGGFTGDGVDGVQCTGDRGDGFHGGTHSQWFTGAHSTLDTAGTVGAAAYTVGTGFDLVVCGRTAPGRGAEPVADLDTLDGLDAHECPGQARVQSAVPVHVAAQPGWQPVDQYLDDTAQGVTGLAGVVDLLDH